MCVRVLLLQVHTEVEKKALGTVAGFGKMFGPNARGPDVATFGRDAVDRFLEQTGCLFIVRAHEKVGQLHTPRACVCAITAANDAALIV